MAAPYSRANLRRNGYSHIWGLRPSGTSAQVALSSDLEWNAILEGALEDSKTVRAGAKDAPGRTVFPSSC